MATGNSDVTLAYELAKGSQNALGMLHGKYYADLCSYAEYLLKNAESAEEAVSDVFLKLWKNRGSLEKVDQVRAYLYRAVKNQCLNALKKKGLEVSHSTFEEKDKELINIPDERVPEEDLEYKELAKLISEIISELTPQQQEVFRLSRLEGFNYKEIGEILGIAERTVQNHMVKAIEYVESQFNRVKDHQFEVVLMLLNLLTII